LNPNSAHQIWSRWTFTVTPGRPVVRAFAEVQGHSARFGRKAFGAASEMKVECRGEAWTIDVRTEGHPVHEDAYVTWMTAQWSRFFKAGFGIGTVVECVTKLEAGSRQDGRPADQLIIVPPIAVEGVV